MLTSQYDVVAPSFERDRALPLGVPESIRMGILSAVACPSRPRLLDLGAGTGRLGWPFVAAGDDYIGLDLSSGMLREFQRRCDKYGHVPRLVQANGQLLPFRDTTFDAVMLMQVFGGMSRWRELLAEARRVLRPSGVLITGRTVMPAEGLDAQMKQHLAALLIKMNAQLEETNVRDDAQHWLESVARTCTREVAAAWNAERTPRGFLERHRTGARFSLLPDPIKEKALDQLAAWAAAQFGSLDAVFSEQHSFELQVYRFAEVER